MLWLILVVVVWGIVHSFMASLRFKEFLRGLFGSGALRLYRFLYNVFSAISFLPIIYLMLRLPDKELYQIHVPWSILMLAGQGISAVFLLITLLQTDVLSFIGLRQLFEEGGPGRLVISGFYRFMRHPLYTFGLLILWLSPVVSLNTFVVYFFLTAYILVGAYFEERKLVREFGREYADYRSATPMFLPFPRFGGNKR